jgi:hypothetical protein
LVFPRAQGESLGEAFDDDGVTEAWRDGDFSLRRLRLRATSEDLEIALDDPADRIEVLLPADDQRAARAIGWRIATDQHDRGRRRLILERMAAV